MIRTTVGYSGGAAATAAHRRVSTGRTGHVEAVQVVFDHDKVTHEQVRD